ncbi:MAG: hypothetical protein KDD70_02275 [Bdellovibrionales bacterium]|nr:hypothetical protein [Bdellovibrionales bacterium]
MKQKTATKGKIVRDPLQPAYVGAANRAVLYFIILLPGLFNIPVAFGDSLGEKAHQELFSESEFPRAKECGGCHTIQYKEWSASPHAYAQLSPVFNAMNAKLLKLTNGTIGDFCIRCHTPVGMDSGEKLVMPNSERSAISREGVTCITCHRREQPAGKASGRFGLSHGDIFNAVSGPTGGAELARVISSGEFEVNSERGKEGRAIHPKVIQNNQMTTSGFCGTCHDVNSPNNFRLEEAFSEYKSAPAAGSGVSCQDCHMGTEPGVPSEYATMPAAFVGGRPTKMRRHANHLFVGPDYSVVHPGIFPHSSTAEKFASISEWIQFDYQAGWGTEEFEDYLEGNEEFPERWQSAEDRFEARDILNENLDILEDVSKKRKALLQKGYLLGDIRIHEVSHRQLSFSVQVANGTTGHNVPTGFDGERVVFLRVTVTDRNGDIVFLSGDFDPNGDLRNAHSRYVHDGKLPLDDQLFNLQSLFIADMIRGGDREQVLAVNYSTSPLPFLRPATNANLLVGRPVGIRKHRQTIPPMESRWANYRISEEKLKGVTPPFRLTIELVAGMVPVNLIYAIQDVGFDYQMSPRKVADAVVAGYQVLWKKDIELRAEQGG